MLARASISWSSSIGSTVQRLSPTRTSISADPAAGSSLNPKWNETVRGSFLVAAYRRPDFRVDAALSADPPVLGGTLHGLVHAKYR